MTHCGKAPSRPQTTLTNYVSSLRFLFRPGGTQQLGGFITLGSIFSPEWDWRSFWNITALLSIILAFMNLLPIPALDGGHVMFLLYEMISGRKPSDKVMEYGQLIGLLLVGSLMLLGQRKRPLEVVHRTLLSPPIEFSDLSPMVSLDLDHLKKIVGNDPAFLRQVLQIFLANAPKGHGGALPIR